MSKTKVAPIKRLTIPRLELCGANLLAQILHHCKEVFSLPLKDIFAWTDSTIVLNWLVGSPRRFKTYVGNRVSSIMQLSLLIIGTTSMVWRILQTVHREVCFLQNF
jgi:hypothetical protein